MTSSPVLTASVEREVAAHRGPVTFHDVYDEVGSLIYDDLAQGDRHEVPEIARLLRECRGPVLELAAGSGRITLPLLMLGLDVVALDSSPSMLRRLESRLEDVPLRVQRRCHTVTADMSSFLLDQRFDAVVLGTTSVSLLDDGGRRAMIRQVARHLLPGGRFLVSTVQRTQAAEGSTELLTGASGRHYALHETWPDGQCTIVIVPESAPGEPLQVCTSQLRVLDPDVLIAELSNSGFHLTAAHRMAPAGQGRDGVLIEAQMAA